MKKILIISISILFLTGCSFGNDKKEINKVVEKIETFNIQETEVIRYVPPEVLSNEIYEGKCWTNSIAAYFRTDAWRCNVGNSIEDPCFSLSQSDRVFCLVNPRDVNLGILIKLTEPLPEHFITGNEGKENGAWFIELEDGTTCSPITGASDVNEKGERANYACISGGDIYGELVKGTIWTTTDGREIKRVWQ